LTATGNILTALGLAALAGGMLFFGVVMAPLVFVKLPPDVAGPFIRAAFPFYYAYIIISGTLAACGFLLIRQRVSAIMLFAVVGLTYFLWFWFLPHLEVMRLTGDAAGFDFGHKVSVWLNGAELIVAVGLLVQFALRK
jgi:hypothetical protein